jgi:hypothetical protein
MQPYCNCTRLELLTASFKYRLSALQTLEDGSAKQKCLELLEVGTPRDTPMVAPAPRGKGLDKHWPFWWLAVKLAQLQVAPRA